MTHTTTTYDFQITVPLSKKDILFRLFNAGHITFDELWVLAQDTVVNNYISQPAINPFPVIPFEQPYPMYPPLVTYCKTNHI